MLIHPLLVRHLPAAFLFCRWFPWRTCNKPENIGFFSKNRLTATSKYTISAFCLNYWIWLEKGWKFSDLSGLNSSFNQRRKMLIMLTNCWNRGLGRWRWYRRLHGGTVRRRIHPTGWNAGEGRWCPRAELRPSRPLVREAWHTMRRHVVSGTSHTARSLRPTFRMLHPTKQEKKHLFGCTSQKFRADSFQIFHKFTPFIYVHAYKKDTLIKMTWKDTLLPAP